MVDARRRAASALALAAVMAGGVWWWFARPPQDPEALFRKRCTSCHVLPDVSVYRQQEMRAIVATMLEKNGANAVITPAEAERIIAYLEEVTPP